MAIYRRIRFKSCRLFNTKKRGAFKLLDFLFNAIVYPIQIIINIVFMNITDLFHNNYGIAIIGVSFVVSLLCLPMYDKAHNLQEEENHIQKKMEPKLKIIKGISRVMKNLCLWRLTTEKINIIPLWP